MRKMKRTNKKYKKRTYRKKRMTLVRPMKPIISMKRTFYGGAWTFGTASTSGFWQYLSVTPANNFNNFTELGSVFDEFKVNGLKITFRPRYDNIEISNSATQVQAYAHYFVDPASTVIPTGVYSVATLNSFLENSGVKTRTLNRPFSIYFKPKCSQAYTGTGTVGGVITPRWVKTNETTTSFRGVHVFLQQNNMAATNTNITLDVYYTWYVSFKNLK